MDGMIVSRGGMDELLAPGVLGYKIETEDAIYIPLIQAVTEGSGAVGAYLDSLPADRAIKIPDVISDRLRKMLLRRGYVVTHEYAEEFEEDVEIMTRYPQEVEPA